MSLGHYIKTIKAMYLPLKNKEFTKMNETAITIKKTC